MKGSKTPTNVKAMRRALIADGELMNVCTELQDLCADDIRAVQNAATLPFGVLVLNITGGMNEASIIRTACVMGAERFINYGVPKMDKRTTVGSDNWIDIETVDARIPDAVELNYKLLPDVMNRYGYTPVFVEQGGISLGDLDMSLFIKNQQPKKPCLIFGNESLGIPSKVIAMFDQPLVVSIPQRGVVRSLNVSVAAGIVIHHFSTFIDKKINVFFFFDTNCF